ncbi:MAG: hypothetical protein ACRDRW_17790 [Pseudonocardiaceae bacterium]
MSTPDETFRATLPGQISGGKPTTLIVTRLGLGRARRACLTGNGGIKATVILTSQEAERLAGLLGDASSAGGLQ